MPIPITSRPTQYIKELTGGASVMAMEQDVPALKAMKAPSGKPHPIDRVLKDW